MFEPTPSACRNLHTHDDQEPKTSFADWSHWAQQMAVTHTQHRCPSCSLYKIWLPKAGTDNALLQKLAARKVS